MEKQLKQEPLILAIESSCDETAVAVIRGTKELLSHCLVSQVDLHAIYGGVVPELAGRHHLENMHPLIEQSLERAGISLHDLDAIAVTYGPGLIGALLVGVASAKSLAWSLDLPLIAINHLEGHLLSPLLEEESELTFPYLCLLVSGGHTQLLLVKDLGRYKVLGQTRDDAVGEAYDKVAKMLGLPYPGGPSVEQLARLEAQEGEELKVEPLPRPMIQDGLDFSLSGLKTAVRRQVERYGKEAKGAICLAFQQAIEEVLTVKVLRGVKRTGVSQVVLAGGVAANRGIRRALESGLEKKGGRLIVPRFEYCTDNAAMIACVAVFKYQKGEFAPSDLEALARISF